MEVASLNGFLRQPQAFYDWIYPLAKLTAAAQPNAAHRALAQLEAGGRLQCVITQNIDMLHSKAGSRIVYEVHGHLREMTCMQCQRVVAGEPVIQTFLQTAVMPHCELCAGVLKPNVILFGENLPHGVMVETERHVAQCDLMLVAGSSLEVMPVCNLPWEAKRHGARLIIVNFEETYADELADVVIRADVAEVLPRLAVALATGANVA
jgi:NAD-dependent deacetylase